MSTNKNQPKGFTIIEVVLVLAIAALIFLLVFLALPALQRSRRDTQRRDDLGRALSQVQTYQANNNGKVPDSEDLDTFLTDYMKGGGEDGGEFVDPLGEPYSFVAKSAEEINTSAPNTPKTGEIYYATDAKCDGQKVAEGTNSRNIAMVVKLEGSGVYCADNS